MSYSHRAVFALACMGMLIFGVVVTTLGSILPAVTGRFAVDKAAAGSLFLTLSLGILVGSLVFGPLVDRFGYRVPLVAATLLVEIGLQTIARSDGFGSVRFGVPLIGLGGGIVNGGANALVADISSERKAAGLSLLGVFFGLGAVGVPFALGTFTSTSYTSVLSILGLLALIPLLALLVTRFPPPKQARGFPLRAGLRMLREPALLTFGLLLFFQSGMEITMGGWSSTFAREELALDARASMYFLSLYWLGMMGARLGLTRLLELVQPSRVLFAAIAIAFTGALLLLAGRSTLLAATGIVLVGAGFAPVFPVVLGWVGDRYAALSGTAFSIALVMALIGGMLLPYLTGVLGASLGLRSSLLVVPLALIASSMLLTWISARWLRHPRAQPTD